jgi:Asp-tRNA(Asn)/Glu-tRNA(Gln) amidotransferase A subunit family amidase
MVLSEHLDHVGPFARGVDDIALAYRVLTGRRAKETPPRRVLCVEGPFAERVEEGTRLAIGRAREAFAKAGLPVEDVRLPAEFDAAWDVLQVLLRFGIARHHGTDRDRAGRMMSDRVRELVDSGRRLSEADHAKAVADAKNVRRRLLETLTPGTVVVTAAVDGVAPPFNDTGTGAPELQGLWTLAGLPVLAVPCGGLGGLPVGVQLVGGADDVGTVIAAARRVETILG